MGRGEQEQEMGQLGSWADAEGKGRLALSREKEKLGLGPDREKREFSIFQIFSILFPNSNPNAYPIKFEYDLKYTF